MRGSIRLTRKHVRVKAHAEAIDLEKSVFHSSLAWMPQVSWSKRGQLSPNSGQEIAWLRGAQWTERRGGSYAEFIRVPARNVSPMPRSLNFAQAAVVPVASLSAFQSLFHSEKGALIPGQKVLIHGAAGGVGSFAVQFAKCGGLQVVATCGTANVEYVTSLGAERVIDYKTEQVCEA